MNHGTINVAWRKYVRRFGAAKGTLVQRIKITVVGFKVKRMQEGRFGSYIARTTL